MWTLTGIRGWGCRPGHLLVQVLTIGYGCGRRGSTDVDADRDPRVGPLAQEKGEELSPEAFYYCVGMMDIMSGLLYLSCPSRPLIKPSCHSRNREILPPIQDLKPYNPITLKPHNPKTLRSSQASSVWTFAINTGTLNPFRRGSLKGGA
eukprot:916839-Pyramimonas_sp.AAC.1